MLPGAGFCRPAAADAPAPVLQASAPALRRAAPSRQRGLELRRSRWQIAVLSLCGALHALPAGAVDTPGQSLPPAGRSLFDHLLETDARGEPQVPFPFPALLQRIARELDPAQPSAGLSVVLIPLGRSLQRHAAGDVEAFRYPRVVAAVTGEPPANAPAGHPYLRDRLYIAYHEKAAALEVISYNETAGRFEFQLVSDYRPGGRADVGYANRALCLACHQNAAPIFSRQSWDETSASPPVASRLAATGLPYYGLPWRHGVDVPDAIDAATLRANLLATAQMLWREGCASATREAAVGCRAEALRLALRYRLGGERDHALGLALDTPDSRRRLVEPLLANWQRRWPDGVSIPDPQLPNRQPFAGIEGGLQPPADAELGRYADIAAAFDPLALRTPLETWHGRSAADLGRFVHALSLFFSRADIRLLDRQLALAPDPPVRRIGLDCAEREAANGRRLDLDCEGAGGGRLLARLALDGGRIAGGIIDRLILPGQDSIGAVVLDAAEVADGGAGAAVAFRLHRDGASIRSASGEAIRRLTLARGATGASTTLELADDLVPLDAAIEALEGATLAGDGDVLDDEPLRRSASLAPILARLGLAATEMQSRRPLAPARLADPSDARAAPWPAELQTFLRHCSQCHAAATTFPPGFLRGDDARIRTSLAGCAERMIFRLAMNDLPPQARPKTPMPPPATTHAASFVQSDDLPAMRKELERMLAASGGSAAAVLDRPYATLAPCAPALD